MENKRALRFLNGFYLNFPYFKISANGILFLPISIVGTFQSTGTLSRVSMDNISSILLL